jgi:hypothetical protein
MAAATLNSVGQEKFPHGGVMKAKSMGSKFDRPALNGFNPWRLRPR